MSWIRQFALWSTLLASPLAAQVALSGELLFQAAPVRQAEPAGVRLYFAASPGQLTGDRTLSFEVRLNGKAYIKETVFLETAASEGNLFEFLGTRPDLRARLSKLATGRANRLEILISADQEMIQRFASYPGFLRYSQELRERGVEPRKAFSLVLDSSRRREGSRNLPTKGMQVDPACADQCSADYQYCIDNYGCDYGDCSRCQDQYDHCIYFCPIVCVEPKSVSTSNSVQNWNGPTNTGNVGCYKSSYNQIYGTYYYETVMERKHTTVTTTTHCDNTTSTSTNIWYDNWYCWNASSVSCTYQDLWGLACHF